MKFFFKSDILKKIKENETNPEKISSFLNPGQVDEILDFKNNASQRMVDREESTKIPFEWKDSYILLNLKKKIEDLKGEFEVKDFEPHIITTRFPLRLHADTGKDPVPEFIKSIKMAKSFKNVEILWASVREPYNYIQAKQLGCHIITVPPSLIEKIQKFGKSFKVLTKETVKTFLIDSKKSNFKI